jgi:hypothetical protein
VNWEFQAKSSNKKKIDDIKIRVASPSNSSPKGAKKDLFGNIPTQDSRHGLYQAFEDEVDYNNQSRDPQVPDWVKPQFNENEVSAGALRDMSRVE